MRRNLKVIVLMALVWAGGLVYLVKNGEKPTKQVSKFLTFFGIFDILLRCL